MAIGTQEHTFVRFFLHTFPCSCKTMGGKSELFLGLIEMMKIECSWMLAVATYHAFTPFVFDNHFFEAPASLGYSCFEILCTVSVGSLL